MCQAEKQLIEFHNHCKRPDGKAIYCIPCNKTLMTPKSKEKACIDTRNYASRNREKVNANFKKWYHENREDILAKKRLSEKSPERIAKAKAWTEANRDKINAQRRLRKLTPTPKQIITKILRDRFHKVIIRMKSGTKHTSHRNLIGCDIVTLKKHIEEQFTEGMNWNNHGNGNDKWNIDHIRPLVSFDLHSLEQQQVAFHYINLRPLWFSENIRRGRKTWQQSA